MAGFHFNWGTWISEGVSGLFTWRMPTLFGFFRNMVTLLVLLYFVERWSWFVRPASTLSVVYEAGRMLWNDVGAISRPKSFVLSHA